MTCHHDDNDLFQQAMGDVTPLKTCGSTMWLPVSATRPDRDRQQELQLDNPLTSGLLEIVPCTTDLAWQAAGMQQGVVDKLWLGEICPAGQYRSAWGFGGTVPPAAVSVYRPGAAGELAQPADRAR